MIWTDHKTRDMDSYVENVDNHYYVSIVLCEKSHIHNPSH